jgi:hypothetical protein
LERPPHRAPNIGLGNMLDADLMRFHLNLTGCGVSGMNDDRVQIHAASVLGFRLAR